MEPDAKKIKLTQNENGSDHSRDTEIECGLEEFIYKGQRFSGIIKQRFSDFMVRECDVEGNLVYLNKLDDCDSEIQEEQKRQEIEIDCPIKDSVILDQIHSFSESDDKKLEFMFSAPDDKEERKLVHKFIKQKYKHVETSTHSLNGIRKFKLFFKNNGDKNVRYTRNRSRVPSYCHFVLFKQGRETMDCINLLAKSLRVKTANFGFAGTKDRRAVTVQKVSVKHITSKRLSEVNKLLRNASVGNFSYANEPLKLGDLQGNEFLLIVRNLSEKNDSIIDDACNSLKSHGFINYFGLQRFGTGGTLNHHVGAALLRGEFKEAINMILTPRHELNKTEYENSAKTIWTESGDAEKAFKTVRSKFSIEGKLLDVLSKTKTNFLGAFETLPRNTRLLFLHGFQSYIFNKMLTKRMQEHGVNICEGDLVLEEKNDSASNFETVRVVCNEDVALKKYSIYDVVFPLPGYDMKYPINMYNSYEEILQSHGLDITDMKRKQKDFSLPGSYRKIVIRPSSVSWEIIGYDDYTVPLVQNDLEILQENNLKERANADDETNFDDTTCTSGKYRALKLKMTLPKSCYATTALRELLNAETSFHVQQKLNKEFAEQS